MNNKNDGTDSPDTPEPPNLTPLKEAFTFANMKGRKGEPPLEPVGFRVKPDITRRVEAWLLRHDRMGRSDVQRIIFEMGLDRADELGELVLSSKEKPVPRPQQPRRNRG